MKARTLLAALAALEEVKAATHYYGEIDATTAGRLWHSCMKAAVVLRCELGDILPDVPIEEPEKESA